MIFIFFICNDPTTTELYTLSLHDALPISDWYSWIEFFVDASGRMAKKLNNLLDHANILADRKSTRLNSSHVAISYAVFCLKKNNKNFFNLVGHNYPKQPNYS